MTSDSPFEGKIVIVSYTECNLDTEDTACLVYRVEQGKLVPLLGVLDLPDGLHWHRNDYDQYDVAIAVIKRTGSLEVFVPNYFIPGKQFFGQEFGFVELSEGLNDKNEIEEWCEYDGFLYNWEMLRLLEEHQIKVRYIDPKTMHVIPEEN
ncbi:hypothetical protein K2P47_03105 [Patescibacteria group bacterium]|nr:hypothetical protein [Patescibacteria group bacterium]